MDRSTRNNAVWMAVFTGRLLMLKPGMDVLHALRIAKDHLATMPDNDPDEAAQRYARVAYQ